MDAWVPTYAGCTLSVAALIGLKHRFRLGKWLHLLVELPYRGAAIRGEQYVGVRMSCWQ
jgi:hypothetical protein